MTIIRFLSIYVREKPKGQSRMDNPETLETLGTELTKTTKQKQQN